MPTTYAHYTFGMQVYNHLDEELKQVIEMHRSLFLVALHGPDILFYYRPLMDNPLAKLGHDIHSQPAAAFFGPACKKLQKNPDRGGDIAYLVGFFCHFMLDRGCHPLVREATRSDKAEHNRLEKEFDRQMMIRDQLDPLSYRPTGHLVLRPGDAATIARFYPDVTDIQIKKAVGAMKRVLEILVTPGKWKYRVLKLIFHLIVPEKKLGSLLMAMKPISEFTAISDDLADLLYQLVMPTSVLANELYVCLRASNGEHPLSDEMLMHMNQNFG